MKDENGLLFREKYLRTIYAYWQLPQSLHELRISSQMFHTAQRSRASCTRLIPAARQTSIE